MTAPDSAAPEIEAAEASTPASVPATVKRVPAPSSPEPGAANRELTRHSPAETAAAAEDDEGTTKGRPAQTRKTKTMTNTKKIENSANSALDILLFDRDALVGQIAAIEAKEKPSEVERYALEGMRSKLAEINLGIAPQIEASIVARLFDVASEINSLVGENCEYLISLKDDGSDPEVTLLRGKGRKARKASGETQKKRVFAWNVNGLGIKEGATDIVKNLANCLVLATGEYKKYDVKGCCARKGWKVAPDIGPVALLLQGKIVKDESGKASRIPHALKLSSGKENRFDG